MRQLEGKIDSKKTILPDLSKQNLTFLINFLQILFYAS
jgi:hypothetical protein